MLTATYPRLNNEMFESLLEDSQLEDRLGGIVPGGLMLKDVRVSHVQDQGAEVVMRGEDGGTEIIGGIEMEEAIGRNGEL